MSNRHLTVPIKPQGNVTTAVAAEAILNRQVVALNDDGEAIVASKDDENAVNIIGFATNSYVLGETVSIQTFGPMDGFTSLDDGQPVYLDNDGEITQTYTDIGTNEYRAFLGFAVSVTDIFVSIQEATLNSITSSLVSALVPKVYIKSADFVMTQSDMSYTHTYIYYETGSTNYDLSLVSSPSSAYIGSTVTIQKTDDGAGFVTVLNSGLDDDPQLDIENESVELIWNGVEWKQITTSSSSSGGGGYNVGDVFYSANSGLGRSDGVLPFGYGAVPQDDFAELYAIVGDAFETSWTSLGYSASGTGNFYPTPPPGVYPRAAIPRSEISTSEVDTANDRIDDPDGLTFAFHILKDGTPVILTTDDTAPGGITAGTVYYARLVNTNGSIEFYDTAAHAINTSATTGRVDITSTGTGPHYISNAGVRLDDAFQGHRQDIEQGADGRATDAGGPGASEDGQDQSGTTGVRPLILTDRFYTDGTNGTPRTTNETRPDTILLYAYIKASHVTPTGEAVSALRYSTGWVANSTWEDAELTASHNLDEDLSNLIVKFFLSTDGTEANSFEVYSLTRVVDTGTGNNEYYGITLLPVDSNSFYAQTGLTGLAYIKDNGTWQKIIDGDTFYYKVVVYKPNILANYTGSRNTVISIADATDQTVAIPSASSIDYPIFIKRVGAGTGVVNLSFQTGEDETGVVSLEGDGGYIELIPSGGKWYIRDYWDSGDDGSGNYWEKRADGTMEQWGEITGIDCNSGALNTYWYNVPGGITVTFAKTFTSVKNLSCSWANGSSMILISARVISTTGGELAGMANTSQTGLTVGYHAIGRWK